MARLDQLFVSLRNVNAKALLEEWWWCFREPLEPLLLTAFGDWFLKDWRGGIHFLDVGMARLRQVAKNKDELEELLLDRGRRQTWLLEAQVDALLERGLEPGSGECYSWRTAPVLGGSHDLSNVEVAPISVHEVFLAQINRQVKNGTLGTQSTMGLLIA